MQIDQEPPDDDEIMRMVEAQAAKLGKYDADLEMAIAIQDFLLDRPSPYYPTEDPKVIQAYDAALIASSKRLARLMDADLPRLDDTLPDTIPCSKCSCLWNSSSLTPARMPKRRQMPARPRRKPTRRGGGS